MLSVKIVLGFDYDEVDAGLSQPDTLNATRTRKLGSSGGRIQSDPSPLV